MKRTKKQVIITITAILLVLSLFPAGVMAGTEEYLITEEASETVLEDTLPEEALPEAGETALCEMQDSAASAVDSAPAAIKTGLYKVNGKWRYYENGKFTKATGMVKRPSDGNWFYVENGLFTKATGLVKRVSDGKWFYVKDGKYTKYTGRVPRVSDGKYFYVVKGYYTKTREWKALFKKYINNNSNGKGNSAGFTLRFALAYVDEDSYPEMFVQTDRGQGWLVFVKNGTAKEVSAAGYLGTIKYMKKKNQIFSSGGNVSSFYYTVYKFASKKVTTAFTAEMAGSYNGSSTYYVGGKEVTQSAYESAVKTKFTDKVSGAVSPSYCDAEKMLTKIANY